MNKQIEAKARRWALVSWFGLVIGGFVCAQGIWSHIRSLTAGGTIAMAVGLACGIFVMVLCKKSRKQRQSRGGKLKSLRQFLRFYVMLAPLVALLAVSLDYLRPLPDAALIALFIIALSTVVIWPFSGRDRKGCKRAHDCARDSVA